MKAERTKKKSGKLPTFDVLPREDATDLWRELDYYPVHFVGLRYYTVKSYVEEAKRLGVSRALPVNVLKRFNWGDPIFLAIHVKEQSEDGKEVIPTAVVFGYFRIGWLQFKATPRVHQAVANDPRLNAKHYALPSVIHENRGCGEYDVVGVTTVGKEVTLPMLISVIREHAKRFGDKVKVMVGGVFEEIDPPLKLRGVKFTQSVTFVNLPDDAKGYLRAFVKAHDFDEPPAEWLKLWGVELDEEPDEDATPRVKHVRNYRLAKPHVGDRKVPEEWGFSL